MCPAINSFEFGADAWNEAFYDTMASVAKSTRVIHEKATQAKKIIAFPARLWILERHLNAFVIFLKNPEKGYKGVRPGDVPTSEQIEPRDMAERLLTMAGSIGNLYDRCKQTGWTNRILTAASLNSLRKHADFIADFGEMVSIAVDPQTEERFESAHQQYLAGETVGLDAIK